MQIDAAWSYKSVRTTFNDNRGLNVKKQAPCRTILHFMHDEDFNLALINLALKYD